MMAQRTTSCRPETEGRHAQEQRRWVRYTCGPETSCRLLGDAPLDCWAVQVRNLSAGGINLVFDRVVPTGKVLTLELHHSAHQLTYRRQIRVIYSLKEPGGAYSVGATFLQQLTGSEIQGLS
jgi:hypothetical protein